MVDASFSNWSGCLSYFLSLISYPDTPLPPIVCACVLVFACFSVWYGVQSKEAPFGGCKVFGEKQKVDKDLWDLYCN